MNPAILNEGDVERATEPVMVPPRYPLPTVPMTSGPQRTPPPLPAPQLSAATTSLANEEEPPPLTGDTPLRVHVTDGGDGVRTVEVARPPSQATSSTSSSTTQEAAIQTSTPAISDSLTPLNEAETIAPSASSANTVDRQNLDVVLLSRHIEHMQRICRASLHDLAVTRQRRQVVRLQSIRR
jgi:hypothetical protein